MALPDGTYEGRVTKKLITTTQKGDPRLVITFTITGTNEEVSLSQTMTDTPIVNPTTGIATNGIELAWKAMRQLGLDPAKIDDLESQACDGVVSLVLKTKPGGRQNVYIASGPEPMDKTKAMSVAAKLRAQFAKLDATQKVTPVVRPMTDGSLPPGDDGVPW